MLHCKVCFNRPCVPPLTTQVSASVQGKRAGQPLTPQPQQQSKKQKGQEGKAVPASAPAKGPAAKTAAAAPAGGDAAVASAYKSALVAELKKGGSQPLSTLATKVSCPLWGLGGCGRAGGGGGTRVRKQRACWGSTQHSFQVEGYTGTRLKAVVVCGVLVAELKKGGNQPLSTLTTKVGNRCNDDWAGVGRWGVLGCWW